MDSLLHRLFVPWTIFSKDYLLKEVFAQKAICSKGYLLMLHWLFPPRTLCSMVFCSKNYLLHGLFAPWTPCSVDSLFQGLFAQRTICSKDILFQELFALWNLCFMDSLLNDLFASRALCSMNYFANAIMLIFVIIFILIKRAGNSKNFKVKKETFRTAKSEKCSRVKKPIMIEEVRNFLTSTDFT